MISVAKREFDLGRWLAAPAVSAWRHRELITVVLQRELAQRFRGSMLGWIWAVIAPLVMLAVYTALFSGPLRISTSPATAGVGGFALSLFAGLIVFGLFSEVASRAPNLLRENAWFLKKTIIPSDALAWIVLGRTLVYAAISLCVLLVFEIAFTGRIPITVLFLPVIVVPLCMFLHDVVSRGARRLDARCFPRHGDDSPRFHPREANFLAGRGSAGAGSIVPVFESADRLYRDAARRGLLWKSAEGLGLFGLSFVFGARLFIRARSVYALSHDSGRCCVNSSLLFPAKFEPIEAM